MTLIKWVDIFAYNGQASKLRSEAMLLSSKFHLQQLLHLDNCMYYSRLPTEVCGSLYVAEQQEHSGKCENTSNHFFIAVSIPNKPFFPEEADK